jgi:hypothetical protein
VQRWMRIHSPSPRTAIAIGSIEAWQAEPRSPGVSSTWRLHRQLGQWLRCAVPGATAGTSSRQWTQRNDDGGFNGVSPENRTGRLLVASRLGMGQGGGCARRQVPPWAREKPPGGAALRHSAVCLASAREPPGMRRANGRNPGRHTASASSGAGGPNRRPARTLPHPTPDVNAPVADRMTGLPLRVAHGQGATGVEGA